MAKTTSRNIIRLRKHARVRRKINGTEARPRLSVFRSSKHIYVQAVDDQNGNTIASASSLDAELKIREKGGDVDAAKAVGELIGRRLLDKGIEEAIFDRGGYAYHGRVAALADGARSAGLRF